MFRENNHNRGRFGQYLSRVRHYGTGSTRYWESTIFEKKSPKQVLSKRFRIKIKSGKVVPTIFNLAEFCTLIFHKNITDELTLLKSFTILNAYIFDTLILVLIEPGMVSLIELFQKWLTLIPICCSYYH